MRFPLVVILGLIVFIVTSIFLLSIKKQAANKKQLITQDDTTVVLYLFHYSNFTERDKDIEIYTKETMARYFPRDVDQEKLLFKKMNVEIPSKLHIRQEFNLSSKALVIVKFVNGNKVDWKNLDQSWELMLEPNFFVQYLQSEIKTFVKSQGN